MNKEEVDRILAEVNKSSQNLNLLIGEARARLLALDPAQREMLKEVENEFHKVQNAIKTGDHSYFEKILTKYAR